MKDVETRLHYLSRSLKGLAETFGVRKPNLLVTSLKKAHGFYALDTITINVATLRNNLSLALTTLRHEFCHYLQDELELDDRKPELNAIRFEKNILTLGVKPISQRLLQEFVVEGDK